METKVARVLSRFAKGEDDFLGDSPIKGLDITLLRGFLNAPADDPLFDSWPVGPREAALLQPFVATAIDLDRYDYFVECHAEAVADA